MFGLLLVGYLIGEFALFLFTVLTVSAFLGSMIRELSKEKPLPNHKIVKLFFLVLFPEISAFVWGIFFAQNQTVKSRILTIASGALFLLLEIGYFYVNSGNDGLAYGLISTTKFHFISTLIVLVFSFLMADKFALRAM